jgi:hypothetical protein
MDWLNFLQDPSMVALLFGSIVTAYLLWLWHKEPGEFDLRHMLLDNKTGKIGVEKVGLTTALVSTWGFVALIQDGKMTEWYAGLYMATWTGAKALRNYIDLKRDSDASRSGL